LVRDTLQQMEATLLGKVRFAITAG